MAGTGVKPTLFEDDDREILRRQLDEAGRP
jgi:hypothetical protein